MSAGGVVVPQMHRAQQGDLNGSRQDEFQPWRHREDRVHIWNLQKIDVNGKDALYASDYLLLGLQCATELLQLVEYKDDLGVCAASFTNLLDAVFEKPVNVILELLELIGQKPLQLPAEIGCRFQLEFQVEPRLDAAEQLLSGRLIGYLGAGLFEIDLTVEESPYTVLECFPGNILFELVFQRIAEGPGHNHQQISDFDRLRRIHVV